MSNILPSGVRTDFADHENNWGSFFNNNWKLIDALMSRRVLDKDLSTPPGSPLLADSYIVGPAATGAWNGYSNYIAIWSGTVWQMVQPLSGWRFHVVDEAKSYVYQSGAWSSQFTATTVNAANMINDAGIVTIQSKTTGTANIAQRLQAGTETSLTTVSSATKVDGALPLYNFYGLITINYTNQGASATQISMPAGTGSPEGVVSARGPSIYFDRGAAGTAALYMKETGTGNTGWRKVALV